MSKRLGLAERIAKNKTVSPDEKSVEKALLLKVTTHNSENKKVAVSGQYQDSNRTVSGQDNGVTVTPFLMEKVAVSGQYQDSIDNDKKSSTIVAPFNKIINLPKKQLEVYNWFLKNGLKGTFNKPLIELETKIAYATIRKALKKLETLDIIQVYYDRNMKLYEYSINPNIHIKNNKKVAVSGQYQDSNRTVSGHDNENTSYKTDRKINNLSIFLKNSDFWSFQKLTLKKCEQFIEEIEHCDIEFLITQLQFAEHSPDLQKADTPISYFRTCLISGGLERPKNFEFPDERATRLKQQEFDSQKKAMAKQEEIRNQEREQADKISFQELLNDNANVKSIIEDLEKKFLSSKMKISIKQFKSQKSIDTNLENALLREFKKDV